MLVFFVLEPLIAEHAMADDGSISFDLECIRDHLGAGHDNSDMVTDCEVRKQGFGLGQAMSKALLQPSANRLSTHQDLQLSRSQFLGAAAATALAAATPVLPAFADSTSATRARAADRYVPRIERGRDFWGGGVKNYIKQGNWQALQAELAPLKKKSGGRIMEIVPPLRLYASSFSGNSPTPKTEAMDQAADEFEAAIKNLKIAVKGEEETAGVFGLFKGTKSMDEANRKKLAVAAYQQGVVAFNKYIQISNDDVGVGQSPIDLLE